MGADPILLAKIQRPLTDDEVHDISVEMCQALGAQHFMILREHPLPNRKPRHALFRCDPDDLTYIVDEQGQPIDGESGMVLRMCLLTSYYSVDYERGDFLQIANAAQWVEARIPGAVMLYGDDEERVVTRFGMQERSDLWAHFAAHGNRPYKGAEDTPTGPRCEFCRINMKSMGWANGAIPLYFCKGCQYIMLKHPNGRVVLSRTYADRALQIAVDDAEWAAYEQDLGVEVATSVAMEMCQTKEGLLEAVMCKHPVIREYAASVGPTNLR